MHCQRCCAIRNSFCCRYHHHSSFTYPKWGALSKFFEQSTCSVFEPVNNEYSIGFMIAFFIYQVVYIAGNWSYVQRYTSVFPLQKCAKSSVPVRCALSDCSYNMDVAADDLSCYQSRFTGNRGRGGLYDALSKNTSRGINWLGALRYDCSYSQ